MQEIKKTDNPSIGMDSQTPTSKTQYELGSFVRFGKEIKISPKANTTILKEGYKKEFFVESVNVLIGIGKDHTAELIMSKDAWEALNNGEPVNISTTEDFKKRFVYKSQKYTKQK